jgi:hypothetical protein
MRPGNRAYMLDRPAVSVALAALIGLLAVGCGDDDDKPSTDDLEAGTYEGTPHCEGSDSYSSGRKSELFDSRPRVTVRFNEAGDLTNWTYVFLGKKDKLVQSDAIREGQSFHYGAGTHIAKPGRTKVTILNALSADREERLKAAIDWSSPSTNYAGHGSYSLRLKPTGDTTVEYQSNKAVVKSPESGRVTRDDPVVRRIETCIGELKKS